jgi:spore germination protein
VRFWQFSSDTLTPGIDPYLPEVHVSSSGKEVSVNRVALYRHLHYVTTLNARETTTFGLLKGLARKVSIFIPKEQAALRNIHGSSTLRIEPNHGHIHAIFHITLSSTLQSIKTETETAQQLSQLSQEASQLLAHRAVAFLHKTQKLDVDPLGVGRQLDWRYPDTFRTLGSWHNEYPKISMTVHVTVRIDRMGDVK